MLIQSGLENAELWLPAQCAGSQSVLCKPDTWWLKCASAAIVLQLMAYSSCPFLSFKIENQSLGII